jgi:hypothetical protein
MFNHKDNHHSVNRLYPHSTAWTSIRNKHRRLEAAWCVEHPGRNNMLLVMVYNSKSHFAFILLSSSKTIWVAEEVVVLVQDEE